MDLSIIILSYNTKDLLSACLLSLQKKLVAIPHEIIVVDNDSHDGSSEMVKKDFTEVLLIENKENVGFAKGVNLGAEKAKGEYLLLLNSDTEILDDSIKEMTLLLDQDKHIGVVGGIMVNSDGSHQRSYGKFYTIPQVFLTLLAGDKGEFLQQKIERGSVDWVSGGFMMTRKSLFEKLNGLDEHFFMYLEDMEYCYRVKKHRFHVRVLPQVTIKHVGHGSSNRTFAIVHIYKGILYFYQKHRSAFSYILVRCLLLLKAYIAIGIGRLTRNRYLTKTYTEAVQYII